MLTVRADNRVAVFGSGVNLAETEHIGEMIHMRVPCNVDFLTFRCENDVDGPGNDIWVNLHADYTCEILVFWHMILRKLL